MKRGPCLRKYNLDLGFSSVDHVAMGRRGAIESCFWGKQIVR